MARASINSIISFIEKNVKRAERTRRLEQKKQLETANKIIEEKKEKSSHVTTSNTEVQVSEVVTTLDFEESQKTEIESKTETEQQQIPTPRILKVLRNKDLDKNKIIADLKEENEEFRKENEEFRKTLTMIRDTIRDNPKLSDTMIVATVRKLVTTWFKLDIKECGLGDSIENLEKGICCHNPQKFEILVYPAPYHIEKTHGFWARLCEFHTKRTISRNKWSAKEQREHVRPIIDAESKSTTTKQKKDQESKSIFTKERVKRFKAVAKLVTGSETIEKVNEDGTYSEIKSEE